MQRQVVAFEGREYDASRFMRAESVARTVRQAIETPRDAHPTELVLRQTGTS
jgi:NADP-dependent 3-hydroxy acid dehydrogenase YdfG